MTRVPSGQELPALPSPAFRLALCYALGILCGSVVRFPPEAWGVLACALCIATAAAMRTGRAAACSLLAAALLCTCGALRFITDAPESPPLPAPAFPRSVTVTGAAVTPPEERYGRVRFTLRADSCYAGTRGSPLPVSIAVTIRNSEGGCAPLSYGMRLALRGLISSPPDERNPGEFNPRRYDESRGIVAVLFVEGLDDVTVRDGRGGSWLYARYVEPVRAAILRRTGEMIPGVEGEFLKDLLLGERGGIPDDVKEAFVAAGVAHVLAVSGYRVLVVAGMLGGLLTLLRVPRIVRPFVACPALLFYMALTPGDPPVMRGTVMAIVVLTGRAAGRRTGALNSLGVAALVILCADTHQLFDAGFQLSFGAVLAILAFDGAPHSRVGPVGKGVLSRFRRVVAGGVRISLIVSAGTLPLSAACFGRVSVVGLLTNIAVVPATGAAVVLGSLSLAAGSFSALLGESYAALNGLLLEWIIRFSEFAATLPFASFEAGRFGTAGAVAWYAVMGLASRGGNRRSRAFFLAVLLAALNVSLVLPADPAFARSPGRLRLSMIDVGQGDAFLVEFPGGETLLVDAGPATPSGNAGERTIIPFLRRRGIRAIDVMVVTHPDADHSGGAASVLRGIRVGRIVEGSAEASTASYDAFHAAALERGVPIAHAFRGDTIAGPACARLYVLWPPRTGAVKGGPPRRGVSNNASIVFRLVYGGVSILFTGDAEREAESAAIRSYGGFLRSTVLKVAHHGSANATSEEFLEAAVPAIAMVSVGARNRFGHPSVECCTRLEGSGARVLRTDREGAVVLVSDGSCVREVRWR